MSELRDSGRAADSCFIPSEETNVFFWMLAGGSFMFDLQRCDVTRVLFLMS